MMTKYFLGICLPLFTSIAFAQTASLDEINKRHPEMGPVLSFTENKGQVNDQYSRPRPDVLFSGQTDGMVYHLRTDGISYQLSRVDTWKEVENTVTGQKRRVADQITIGRLDMDWLGTNPGFVLQKEGALEGVAHYYTKTHPNGITDVKSYRSIYYNHIYDHIHLHYYEKDNSLKYDYIVLPGGDYKQIRLQVKGAENITVQKDGSLKLKTALGVIEEGAPLVYQNGKRLAAKWIVKDNVLGFEIEKYNPATELIIDPVIRVWGTYYGGEETEDANGCAADSAGNVYITGWTRSTSALGIATAGAYITTWSGNHDGYLAKFNRNGVRQWGTYYAGTLEDYGYACATDALGNVYLTGQTSSPDAVMVSAGCHQPTYGGGGMDAFLVKFNANGIRQWGTFYGGTVLDYGNSCTVDAWGNVYLAGESRSTAGIATPGSHLSTSTGGNKAYLAKFNGNGVRQWGTYYGGIGPMNVQGLACSTDSMGNVYLAGAVGNSSFLDVATPGSHQPTHGGGSGVYSDGFLVKFDSSGVRQWGTFYGGTGTDLPRSCATDAMGNVYISGESSTSAAGTSVATLNGYQAVYGGGATDAFLVKFDGNGVRQWGSFYGGTGTDPGYACITDDSGNVYMTGITNSDAVIATPGSHQTTLGGGFDAFLVKFDENGIRQWGTYYGGSTYDYGHFCAMGDSNYVYLLGYTESSSGIATPGSHKQVLMASDGDGFLVKFQGCDAPLAPTNNTDSFNQNICYNTSTVLNAGGTGTLGWYSQQTGGAFLGNDSSFTTPALTVSTTYYVQDSSDCGTSPRTAILVTVAAQVLANVVSQTDVGCYGGSDGSVGILAGNGVAPYTYLWSPGGDTSATITGLEAGTYLCTVTDSNGCIGTVTATLIEPAAIVYAQSPTICNGDSVTVGTHVYHTPGTYTDVLTATNGCDSTVTTNVTVNPAVAYTQAISLCNGDSVTVGTHTYTATGTYEDVLQNINGCDSTVTTNLTVNPAVTHTQTITLCGGESITVGTHTYTATGTYVDVLPSANGCDSTVTTNLTVNPVIAHTQTISLCSGESVTVGTHTYTATGTYTDVLPSASGCDSTVTTSLTVNVVNVQTSTLGLVITAGASSAAYQWINCLNHTAIAGSTFQAFTATQNGSYAVQVTQNNCIDTSDCVSIANVSIVENNVADFEVSLYPNPTSAYIYIQTLANIRTVEVMDVSGKKCGVVRMLNSLDFTPLASGVYIVRITDDTGREATFRVLRR